MNIYLILGIIFLSILWLIIGYKSFVYWWTKDFNYTTDDLIFALCMSLTGPLSFLTGWFVHGPINRNGKILKRKK